MTDDPYADFREDNSNLTTVLTQLADELTEAEERVAALEIQLEQAKAYRNDIAEKRIPAAVDGLEGKFTLSDGRTLEVKENIRASIAGDKKAPAIHWLDQHGYGGIVRRKITFEFGKDSTDDVNDFLNYVDQYDSNLVRKDQFDVHHMTLTSWVKEKLGEGEEIPQELFGVYRQQVAKVKE